MKFLYNDTEGGAKMAQINEKIKSLVRGLFEDKQAAKELDDSIQKDSAELKKWMGDRKHSEMMVDDIKVTYQPQVRSTMDEGKVLEIVKSLAAQANTDEQREQILGCIHTKEYIDETELESLIYNKQISKEALEPAMLTKTIFVLNLRRSRKKD